MSGVWGGGGGGRGSPLGQIDSLQEHKNSYCCTLHKSGWGGGGGRKFNSPSLQSSSAQWKTCTGCHKSTRFAKLQGPGPATLNA